MKTAFVTGSTGFLGLNLIEQLVERQWKVIAMHRPTSNIKQLQKFPVACVQGELSDRDRLVDIIPENVDAVFHLASNTSVWKKHNQQQIADNITGTHNMIYAASTNQVKRFVYTSTWETYGTQHSSLNESMSKSGMHSWVNYIKTKAMAEHAIKDSVSHGFPGIIINPAHIIGRYDTSNWARTFKLVHNNKLPGIPPGVGSFCHAEQVAIAHINAAEKGRVGENYLLGGENASFLDLIQKIGELTHQPVPQKTTPHWLLTIAAQLMQLKSVFTQKEPDITPEIVEMVCQHMVIESHKAESELGYQPSSLNVMLQDCYDWLVETGNL